jgi:hypothetical protein
MLRWLFICCAITACADTSRPAESPPPSTTPVIREIAGIKVTVLPDAPANPMCVSYCKRFGACWLNLSNSDPMVAPQTAEQRCLLEQTKCVRQTADLHCCAMLDDCGDFSHCIESSHNVVSDCSRIRVDQTASK